jgi:hypothetical protein
MSVILTSILKLLEQIDFSNDEGLQIELESPFHYIVKLVLSQVDFTTFDTWIFIEREEIADVLEISNDLKE